ncbi:hypothetical protein L0U85_19905 [Glycomyces sp. L485]|uniref:hypothetical protein n=1 Tax=Glycomyces sp. L485 TaxID=2909235 RepID=UPI001F4AB010|nr:hypothetical protein [Glycomyces sp. L485]MCH7233102.1 hypothetical protein [Glycomyces sp. L485]
MRITFLTGKRAELMSIGYTLTVNTLDGRTGSESTGSEERIITDEDQSRLGLTQSALKKAIKEIRDGYEPESAYLHSPARSQYAGDMYDKYGWDQARLRIKPVNVVFDEPGDGQEKQIAVVEHLRNDSNKPGNKYHVDATTEYSDTIENSWTDTNTVKWDLSLDAELKILGTGGGVSTTIGYQHDWTHTKRQEYSYKFGVSVGVEVTLDPGQAVDVLIFGKVAQYTAHVTYLVDMVSGDCAYCWGSDDWHDGHHDWANDAWSVASHAATFPQQITETVKFGFASDGTVKVVDADSGGLMGQQSIDLVPAEKLPLRIDARAR